MLHAREDVNAQEQGTSALYTTQPALLVLLKRMTACASSRLLNLEAAFQSTLLRVYAKGSVCGNGKAFVQVRLQFWRFPDSESCNSVHVTIPSAASRTTKACTAVISCIHLGSLGGSEISLSIKCLDMPSRAKGTRALCSV